MWPPDPQVFTGLDLIAKIWSESESVYDLTAIDTQRDLSVSLNKLGDFLASRGQPGDAEKALGHYERSLEVSEGLLRDNPQSGQAARDVSSVATSLGCSSTNLATGTLRGLF